MNGFNRNQEVFLDGVTFSTFPFLFFSVFFIITFSSKERSFKEENIESLVSSDKNDDSALVVELYETNVVSSLWYCSCFFVHSCSVIFSCEECLEDDVEWKSYFC